MIDGWLFVQVIHSDRVKNSWVSLVFNWFSDLPDFPYRRYVLVASIKNLGRDFSRACIGMTLEDKDGSLLHRIECTHNTLRCTKCWESIHRGLTFCNLGVQLIICGKQDTFWCMNLTRVVYH